MRKRHKAKKKRHLAVVRPKPVYTSNNPAYKSWKEILNGRHDTIFGYIVYED